MLISILIVLSGIALIMLLSALITLVFDKLNDKEK